MVEWGEGEVESSVWDTLLEIEESTSLRSDWLTRKEPEQATVRMKQLEVEFKNIFPTQTAATTSTSGVVSVTTTKTPCTPGVGMSVTTTTTTTTTCTPAV